MMWERKYRFVHPQSVSQFSGNLYETYVYRRGWFGLSWYWSVYWDRGFADHPLVKNGTVIGKISTAERRCYEAAKAHAYSQGLTKEIDLLYYDDE